MAAAPVQVDISEKLALFDDHWSDKIIAQVNELHVKLVKVQGEFVWHHHDDTDELFLVLHGQLTIRLAGRADVKLHSGQLFVVPRGVQHQPVASKECHVMLLERAGATNTGDVTNELTTDDEWI